MYIFLALTSWAHHACRHMYVKKPCIYDEIDRFACVALIVYIILYTLFYTSMRKFIITSMCVFIILLCYSRSIKNRTTSWQNRGLKNWKYHKAHICMHIAATLTGTYVALN